MRPQKRVLLMIESSTAFGREILRGIASYVREEVREEQKWTINIEDRGLLDPVPFWLNEWSGDGIISRTTSSEMVKILQKLNCPYVELHGDGVQSFHEVRCDNRKVCQLAVDHFQECGLPHFAFYSFEHSWWINNRQNTFIELLEKQNYSVHLFPKMALKKNASHPVWDIHYEKALIQWLKKLPKPIGILAAFDPAAIRVINACQKINIRIPEDVAILGTGNDTHLCNLLSPSLSSIDQNPFRIGYEASRLLDLKMQKNVSLPETPIIIKPTGLITRKSTDVINTDSPDISLALRFIRENATLGIRVSDVLRKMNISARTLERGVHKFLGRTPEQEIIRIRMEHARMLLRETMYTVPEIARQSGFSSPEHFVNAFSKVHGMTPLKFRKEISSN